MEESGCVFILHLFFIEKKKGGENEEKKSRTLFFNKTEKKMRGKKKIQKSRKMISDIKEIIVFVFWCKKVVEWIISLINRYLM
jgi:hypothetical protein